MLLAALACAPLAGCGGEPEAPAATRAPSPAQISETGAEHEVTLTFAWPAGARARVESSRTVERTGPAGGTSGRATARWRLAVSRDGGDTVLRTSELSLHPASTSDPGEILNGALAIVTFVPSSRWGSDLENLELVDPERGGEALRRAVEAITTDEVRASPAWQAMSPMLSGEPEMLERQAQSFLRPIAGLDATQLHPTRSIMTRQSLPVPGGRTAEQTITTRLLGVGPCVEGGPRDACVSVEIVADYDASSLQGALGSDGAIRSMQGTLRLLVEPDTLVPHRVTAEKHTEFVMMVEDDPVEMSETETLRWLFRWER